jgi:hypothetical protein
VNAVSAKESAAIRMVQYTFEGDPIISDITFDGNKFAVWYDTTRDAFGNQKIRMSEYAHMLEYNMESVIHVFLTNEEAITDEQYENGIDGYLLYKITPAMPGGLPKVYPDNDELNKAFINAKLLPEVYWATDNKTNLPQGSAAVSIPSGRLVFAFLPTRPREEKSILIDEATLKQIINEITVANVLPKSSHIDWAQADFQDYWLNLYVLTDGNVYNRIWLWGPIRHKKDVYVDISVMSVDSTYAFESWRIESSALGQILIDTWGPKFDLERLHDVTRIDMRVLNFHDTTKVGNKATLEGDTAKDMAERMLKTAKVVTGYGKCGYNIELCFTFSDGTTELGWLNGDSCTGIAMENGPNIMFDKEITRELYKLLDYGEDFISD